jgi:RND family efflux transporter MFP subunit
MAAWAKIVGGAVVVGVAGLTAWQLQTTMERREVAAARTLEEAPVPVDVATAEPRTIAEVVEVVGTLRPDNEVDVVPDVPGRALSVLVDVGDVVRSGQVLARLDATELALGVAQAEAAVAMAVAGRDAARRDLDAAAALGDAVAATQIDALRSRLEAADAQVAQARAAADLAGERLADTALKSPIDGTVTRRTLDVGRMAAPGMPAFHVEDLRGLELVVAVDARVATRLLPGATVEVRADALPGQTFEGKVVVVAPSLDPQTRKAEVVVDVASAAGKLLPHASAVARLVLAEVEAPVAVPRDALAEADGGAAVWVVEPGQGGEVSRRITVSVGARGDGWVEVGGVPSGAKVITAGLSQVADGARVAPRG